MTNKTSHVPKTPRDLTQMWMDINLSAPGFGLPWKMKKTKRRYPGEIEAAFLVAYLESLSQFPAKQKAFIKLLGPPRSDRNEAAEMLQKAIRGGNWAYDIKPGGFVLLPGEPTGIAALAILLLREQGRLKRIRPCHHCSSWFYARFAHQQFCSKKCQEDDYHTPKWRKKNREPNRKHQREYRERNPGRKR